MRSLDQRQGERSRTVGRIRRALSPMTGAVVCVVVMGVAWLAMGGAPDHVAVAQGHPASAQSGEGTWNDPLEVAAVAELYPTEGNGVQGTVLFVQEENGVRIIADIANLSPGEHGLHIHEYGDCTAADATSAGGHYAPYGNPHGAPWSSERHMGDLGNIVADEDGVAAMERVDEVLRLSGPHSIVGRAVVVHAGADDYGTQPSGAAGPRVACGVIGLAERD